MGIQDTSFLGQAYTTRNPLASQTAINIYPELIETTGSGVGGFIGTPGLLGLWQGVGQVRGLFAASDGLLYGVVGRTVYKFSLGYVGTALGDLPTNSGPVSMCDNGFQLVVAHALGWHYALLGGSNLVAVSGAPHGSIVGTQDNYTLFTDGGGQFGITALGDLTSINALDFATAEGSPDNLVSLVCDHREVNLLGTETTELWIDTGAADFPFERASGGFVEQGCAAAFSPAKQDNSVFWLGRDRTGQGSVWRSNGATPIRVSTHAIELAINKGVISDAIGFAYSEEGHLFYQLTLPAQGQTWVYDCTTKLWHQRMYLDPVTGEKTRHRANCYAFFNGKHIVGDFENGQIYEMALNYGDDDGDPVYRERAWEMDDDSHNKIRVDKVELQALMGEGEVVTTIGEGTQTFYTPTIRVTDIIGEYTDVTGITFERVSAGSSLVTEPLVWLQVSNDSGRTWSYERQRTLGPLGARKTRARWRRLGTGRDLVFRVATTMQSKVRWVGAPIQAEVYSA